MKDTFGNSRIASKWCDGNASIFRPFSSITVSFVSKLARPLLLLPYAAVCPISKMVYYVASEVVLIIGVQLLGQLAS